MLPLNWSSQGCANPFIDVPCLLRLEAVDVMSLKACLDAPIRPPRSEDDFGVKKRVNDLGVMVGGLRCLLPGWLFEIGRTGEEEGSSQSVDMAVLYCTFSCDPDGVKVSIFLP